MDSNNKFWRQLFSVLTIIFLVVVVWLLFFNTGSSQTQQVPITQIVSEVNAGKVDHIDLNGDKLTAYTKDGLELVAYKEDNQGIKDYGINPSKITVDITNPGNSQIWTIIIDILLPFLILGAFLYYINRQARMGNSQAMSFGRTTARAYTGKDKVTFEDVAGLKHAKQELQEIVEFLKNPAKFKALGAEMPRGVLLIGPAGVGKTLMAKAVAGEAEVPFLTLSASEFVEMFVGVGASRVRDLFSKAKRVAPTVIFIDELDAVGRQRGTGLGGSHDEREQTLNQILVEMDGFDTDTSVIVLAATNRPDVLDPALLRPGRFDRKVALELPDRLERLQILKIHSRNKPLESSVDLDEVAKSTPGLSGADLHNLMNEAAILAARDGNKKIDQSNFRQAFEKIILGPERTSFLLNDKEREIVAYHESGHAIIGHILGELENIHKVSIVSRGMALGYTLSLPEEDRKLIPQSKYEQEIVQLLGGRAAEKLIFNEVTTGASNDLERATEIARNMVTIFGMSALGPIKMGEREDLVFLGRELGHRGNSEKLTAEIDDQISLIINSSWQKAQDLLKKHIDTLKLMSQELLTKETLEDDDLRKILATLEPTPLKK